MRVVQRRAFLLTAFAAAPLAACAPTALTSGPLAQRRRQGVLVRAGRDRLGAPRTVFGGLRIDAKVPPADAAGDLYVIEHTDEAKGGGHATSTTPRTSGSTSSRGRTSWRWARTGSS